MNQRPSLREALKRADLIEIDELAEEIGQQAVAVALEENREHGAVIHAPEPLVKPSAEEERQRMLDAALADAIEVVARHRARLGRRVCIQSDGKSVRLIFETLRGMPSDPSDQGFPS